MHNRPDCGGHERGSDSFKLQGFKKWTHCFQENACLCTSPAMAGHSPCQFYWRDQDRKWPAASTNQTKFSKSRRHGRDIDHRGLVNPESWDGTDSLESQVMLQSLSSSPPPPKSSPLAVVVDLSVRSCPWDVGKRGDPRSYWLVHVDHPAAARKVSWLNPTGLGLLSRWLGWFWGVWLGVGLDWVG